MMLLLLCVAAAAAAPALYDQRQEGELNVRADVQNVVLLVAIPQKMPFSVNLLEGLLDGKNNEIQQRSDLHVMEAFVEPPTPYRVEIGESTRKMGDDGHVEVVIAGRRSASSAEAEPESEELKLLGATEQCGPGRKRDPETLVCRDHTPESPAEPPVQSLPTEEPVP